MRILMPVLGYDIFRGRDDQTPQGEATTDASTETSVNASATDPAASPVFWLRQGRVEARAQVIDGEFTVLAGSRVMAEMSTPVRTPAAGTQKAYDRRAPDHAKLVEGAELLPDSTTARTARDQVFSSASAAAATVLGRGTTNGRIAWVMGDGRNYGHWESQQATPLNPES